MDMDYEKRHVHRIRCLEEVTGKDGAIELLFLLHTLGINQNFIYFCSFFPGAFVCFYWCYYLSCASGF